MPAIAHDECLTGFTTFGATVFPTALAWAATFDPELVERMTRAIGESMRAVGVHQGLSPVLDVVRDYRWGRVEETLGEDPYLVGVIGTAYVRGLESCDVVATLKHFAGYSASQAARNHAPVAIGPRALRDVLLPPFEMAVREGGARSVMNSYSDIDGLPVAADAGLLTGVLRDEWGFEGVVVSDYWSIAFVQIMHRVAGSAGEAGALALRAGIDVELPHTRCYGEPLAELVRAGTVPEELVDRAARRVLRQKGELGLLDADWSPESPAMAAGALDLDPPAHRALARELAEALRGPARQRRHAAARRAAAHDRARRALRRRPARLPRLLLVPEPRRHAGPRGARARHRGPDAPRRPARASCPAPRSCTSRAARSRSPTGRGSRRRRTRLARLTSASPWSAIAPACSAAAPRARAATPRTSRCPGSRTNCSTRCSRRARRSCSWSCRGGRTRSARYAGRLAAAVQAFIPGEEGGPALAGVLSGRVVAVGQAARPDPAQRRRAAEHVPASRPRRQQRRREQHRPDAAVPLRPRPVVHDLRLLGLHGQCRRDPHRR